MLGFLALLTSLSVLWSIVPELSYIEAGRTLTYLVIFAAAIAGARLAPRATQPVLGGILIGAMLPVAYAIASRIWPGNARRERALQPPRRALPVLERRGHGGRAGHPSRAVARLATDRQPARARRRLSRNRTLRAGHPAYAVARRARCGGHRSGDLVRGGPVAAAQHPRGAGAVAAGAVGAWALSKDAFSKSLQPLAAKEAVAGDFGLFVLLLCLVLLAVGYAISMGDARGIAPIRAQRRIGVVAVAARLVPLVAFTSVAFSTAGCPAPGRQGLGAHQRDRGRTGGRRGSVFAAASTRGKYWREADRVFDERPSIGVGAGSFAVARLRVRTDPAVTRHAHGFVPQTMADLGVLGVIVTSLLLVAWIVAARATALLPRRILFLDRNRDEAELPARRDWDGERTALVALGLVAVVFGCAVDHRLDLVHSRPWRWRSWRQVSWLAAGRWTPWRPPAASARAAPGTSLHGADRRGVGGAALWPAGGVGVWQPEASDRATNDALALSDERRYDEALERAQDAADINPLTPDPLLVAASIDTAAGRETAARQSSSGRCSATPATPRPGTAWRPSSSGRSTTRTPPSTPFGRALSRSPLAAQPPALPRCPCTRRREQQTLEARREAERQAQRAEQP